MSSRAVAKLGSSEIQLNSITDSQSTCEQCSYRVTGVDGSYAKHLTVESYMDIYAANSRTNYY